MLANDSYSVLHVAIHFSKTDSRSGQRYAFLLLLQVSWSLFLFLQLLVMLRRDYSLGLACLPL